MDNPDAILSNLMANDAWVRALAQQLVTDHHAAEDAVQDAWVAALSNPPRKGGSVRSWLGRVVRNFVGLRRQADENRRNRETEAAKPDRRPSVAELRDQERTRHQVAIAVFSLEEPYQSAILSRYFENMPPREIATHLNITVAAVETRLRRGLQKLRARLDRDFGDRKTWNQVVMPLIGTPAMQTALVTGSPSAASVLLGAITMSMKVKVAAVFAILLAAAIVYWYGGIRTGESDPPPSDSTSFRTRPANQTVLKRAKEITGSVTTTMPGPEAGPETFGVSARKATSARLKVTGRVVDSSETPIVSATVRAMKPCPFKSVEMGLIGETRTDANGQFEIEVETEVVLEASAVDFFSLRKQARPGSMVDFVLGSPGRFAGRVLRNDTHDPCPNAMVVLYRWRPRYAHRLEYYLDLAKWSPDALTRTNATGRFSFQQLKPGRYVVRVFPEEHPALAALVVIDIKTDEEVQRNFFVYPGARLQGQILDHETGCPIHGARIGVMHRKRHVLSDPRGFYTIQVRPWTHIEIKADGYALKQDVPFKLPCKRFKRDYRLSKQVVIRGRVIDPSGAGIPGSRVGSRLADLIGINPREGTAQTDKEGRFSLPISGTEIRHVFAVKAGYAWGRSDPLSNDIATHPSSVLVHLQKSATIVGRVSDHGGRPIPDAAVNLKRMDRFEMKEKSGFTDGTGRYALDDVPAGAWRVEVIPSQLLDHGSGDLAPAIRQLSLEPGGRLECNIVLGRGLSISGRVVDEFDQPLQGVSISTIAFKKESRIHIGLDQPVRMAWTDVSGEFRITGLPAEERVYKVDARLPGHGLVIEQQDRPYVQPGETDLVLRLERLHDLTGRVVDSPGGKPTPVFNIVARQTGKYWNRRGTKVGKAFCDSEGRFRIALRKGMHRIEAIAPDGRRSTPATVHVHENIYGDGLVLILQSDMGLSGTVWDPNGRVVTNGRVVVQAESPAQRPGRFETGIDLAGRFHVPSIPPGPFYVSAIHPDHPEWHASQKVIMQQGVEEHIRLDLQVGGALNIEVTDTDGNPIPGARVFVKDGSGHAVPLRDGRYRREQNLFLKSSGRSLIEFFERFTRTDAEGAVMPWSLAPGQYFVEAIAEGYTRKSSSPRVGSALVTRVRLRLHKSVK